MDIVLATLRQSPGTLVIDIGANADVGARGVWRGAYYVVSSVAKGVNDAPAICRRGSGERVHVPVNPEGRLN